MIQPFTTTNMNNMSVNDKQGHDNLHVTLAAIAHRNFYSVFEFFSPANAWLLWKLNVFRKHYSYIKGVFSDARLRSAFTFQVGFFLFLMNV